MVQYPKVLVISHNCFSEEGSNGRTLANFFRGYPADCLAQFYIYNEEPSSDVCKNYYRVTDKEAVKSLVSSNCGATVGVKAASVGFGASATSFKKPKRTPLVYYAREWLWDCGRWDNKRLNKWIDDFSPDMVLFQAGDAAFMYRFALRVAKKRNIPLMIYNSESYYFKQTNYLAKSWASDFFYGILHRRFCKYAKRTIAYAGHSVYITEALKALYDKEFARPSSTIMTSSALVGAIDDVSKAEHKISYLGNLGVGRYESLIELAGILRSIHSELTIDVYGNAAHDVVERLNNTEGIRYCGFVPYEQCVRVMRESEMLVHVENFSPFYLEDSKYAFSTKIPDSLACGTCLFVYAPYELFCTQYLKETGAACVATNRDELRQVVHALVEDSTLREHYAAQGREIAALNHNIEKNRETFQATIKEVANEGITN